MAEFYGAALDIYEWPGFDALSDDLRDRLDSEGLTEAVVIEVGSAEFGIFGEDVKGAVHDLTAAEQTAQAKAAGPGGPVLSAYFPEAPNGGDSLLDVALEIGEAGLPWRVIDSGVGDFGTERFWQPGMDHHEERPVDMYGKPLLDKQRFVRWVAETGEDPALLGLRLIRFFNR
jgi:hypothetical protein